MELGERVGPFVVAALVDVNAVAVLDCGCPLPLLASGPEAPTRKLWAQSISPPFPKRQRAGAVQDLADIPWPHNSVSGFVG